MKVLVLVFFAAAAATSTGKPSPFIFGDSSSATKLTRAALDEFGSHKLGMFMHNGPITQWGIDISWPLVCLKLPCKVLTKGGVSKNITSVDELKAHRTAYFDLAKTYNPASFNATQIAQTAKAAGFRYFVYTTIHCDGFANWDSQVTSYNIMNTPYGRDLYGELATALRKEGLGVGAYICPTLWNNNDFWAPNALTAVNTRGAEAPSYDPNTNPGKWNAYISFLHGLVKELASKYKPDVFWFDCHDTPGSMDTQLELVVAPIRAANPSALVLARNAVFSDYAELVDQSEQEAKAILGQPQMRAGRLFESGTTLQTSKTWAFDPTSGNKPASEVIGNLMMLVAKGGNYLVNVAPGPNGRWADSAQAVLDRMSRWMAVNGEALQGAEPMDPYQETGIYFTAKRSVTATNAESAGVNVYVLIPAALPKVDQVVAEANVRPTGNKAVFDIVDSVEENAQKQSPVHAAATTPGTSVMLETFRRHLLSDRMTLAKAELLGLPGEVKVTQHWNGLELDASHLIPSTPPQHLADGVVFKLMFEESLKLEV